MRSLGIPKEGHGWRAAARTLLHEVLHYPGEPGQREIGRALLCAVMPLQLPRRIGTNPGDGAKAVGQVLAKLYREADGDTLAVDEYEMQRIEREEYDSVERKQRQVKRYVIQDTHTEQC